MPARGLAPRGQAAFPSLDTRVLPRDIGNHMITNAARHTARLDHTFGALGDATRRAILARLARGDATVGELARPFRVSRPAISKHLRVLERAGLVRRKRQGRSTHCTLEPDGLREAAEWVDRYRAFWSNQLDSLARYVEHTTSNPHEEQDP
jgi:DNA-binding transcriptional ArsR family regulator